MCEVDARRVRPGRASRNGFAGLIPNVMVLFCARWIHTFALCRVVAHRALLGPKRVGVAMMSGETVVRFIKLRNMVTGLLFQVG